MIVLMLILTAQAGERHSLTGVLDFELPPPPDLVGCKKGEFPPMVLIRSDFGPEISQSVWLFANKSAFEIPADENVAPFK